MELCNPVSWCGRQRRSWLLLESGAEVILTMGRNRATAFSAWLAADETSFDAASPSRHVSGTRGSRCVIAGAG